MGHEWARVFYASLEPWIVGPDTPVGLSDDRFENTSTSSWTEWAWAKLPKRPGGADYESTTQVSETPSAPIAWTFLEYLCAPALNVVGWAFFGSYWQGDRSLSARLLVFVGFL